VSSSQTRTGVVVAAWALLLGASLLPVVLAQEVLGVPLSGDQRAAIAIAVLAVGLAATLAWRPMRALREFLVVLLALTVAQWVVLTYVDRLPFISERLNDPAFAVYMPTELALKLLVTIAMIAVLLVLKRDRRSFYLAKGDLHAPAAPVSWLRIRPGDRWTEVGRNLAVFITLGTVAFLVLSGRPTPDLVVRVLPILPVIILAAAVNAFNEEVTYKASLLATLVGPVGSRDALRMVAAYFGIAHFYGIPYGLVGVALAWFLGWILARSMLETRGLGWAWFIHFVQDVAIFGFLAIGEITPGG
jgi:hypothetical protein